MRRWSFPLVGVLVVSAFMFVAAFRIDRSTTVAASSQIVDWSKAGADTVGAAADTSSSGISGGSAHPGGFTRVLPDRVDVPAAGIQVAAPPTVSEQTDPIDPSTTGSAAPASGGPVATVAPEPSPPSVAVPSVPPFTAPAAEGYAPKLWGNLPFAPATDPADPLTLAKRFAWDMGSVVTCSTGSFPDCARAVWGRHDPWNDMALYSTVFDRVFTKYEALGAVIWHNRTATAPASEGTWSGYYRFAVDGVEFHIASGGARPGCPAGVLCGNYSVTVVG